MLKPIDIQEKEFEIKVRGYDRDEVDDFLDEIIDTFDILYKTNKSLQLRVDELEKEAEKAQSAKEAVELAKYQCDEMRRRARQEADLIIKNAKESSNETPKVEEDETKLKEAREKLSKFKLGIKDNCNEILAILEKMN